MKKIELAKDIFLIEDFFGMEECKFYINQSEGHGYEEAKVTVDGSQQMFKGIRNNMRVMFKDYELAETLWKRINQFCVQTIGISTVFGLNEMFRYYKYEPGQRFKRHADGIYQRSELEFSFYTLLIYLNDNFSGGETGFKELDVKPKQGTALVFQHDIVHEGKPIIAGTKYVLRTDIMYKIDNTLQ